MDFLADFGVQPILLAAQVVNFLILLFILKRFLYKPLLKVLETRKEKIAKSLEQAEEIERKLQKAGEESKRIIADTLEQSQKILDDSNKAGAQILEDTNKAAEEILKRAADNGLKLAKLEQVKLQEEVRKNLADVVVLVFEKITGKMIEKKEQKQLIEKTLKDIKP